MSLNSGDWLILVGVAGLSVSYLVGILKLRWVWLATGRCRQPVKYLLRHFLFMPAWVPLSVIALQALTPASLRLHSVFPGVPLSEITDLVSRYDIWGGGDLQVGFVAAPELVQTIVTNNGLQPYDEYPITGQKPDWWHQNTCRTDGNPNSVSDLKIYAALDLKDRPRGWQKIMLAYCGRDGRVLIDARRPH